MGPRVLWNPVWTCGFQHVIWNPAYYEIPACYEIPFPEEPFSCTSRKICSASRSKFPVEIGQFMPHSLGASSSHHQRPDRPSSPSFVCREQGAQPILVYPFS